MNRIRTNFYPQKRSPFVCLQCGEKNDDQLPSPRNHCKYCLYSLHVDDRVVGDRLASCRGLMYPDTLRHTGRKGYSIIHVCTLCGKRGINKTAADDDFDLLLQLSSHHDRSICQ